MKKTLFLIFILMLSFSLSSCFQSEEAKSVDAQIKAIGAVTLESNDSITAAEKAVESLLDADKKQLRYKNKLIAARNKYNQLVKQEKINVLELKINEIGEVTLSSKDRIVEVRDFYDKEDSDVKNGIKNYEILANAEEKISVLLIEDAETKINEIGDDITKYNTTIFHALLAYVKLSTDETKQIKNLDLLTKKIDEYNAYKRSKKLILHKTYDKIRDITFYESVFTPNSVTTRKYFLPYIGSTEQGEVLRFVFNYCADDWLFMDEALILVDGERYTVNLRGIKREYISYYAGLYERADFVADDSEIEMLKKIINSKETIVRLNGDKYYSEFTVSVNDKVAMEQVLTAYDGLKTYILMFGIFNKVDNLLDKIENK